MYLMYWNSHFVDQSLVKNFDIEVYNFPLNHVTLQHVQQVIPENIRSLPRGASLCKLCAN